MFANCDQKLYLWINGNAIAFDAPTEYGDLQNECPTRADLQPVGIASSGVKMKLEPSENLPRHLLHRHRRQIRRTHRTNIPLIDLRESRAESDDRDSPAWKIMARFFSDPELWHEPIDNNNMEKPSNSRLSTDEFFAMGDNSAKSADSRIWGTVPRDLLIGKAFFVYWPHSWHRIPATKIPFPFFPNFSRMGFVR